MKFETIFKNTDKLNEHIKHTTEKVKIIKEKETKKPEEILRGANIKIKLVTPTAFGTQIDFSKKYDEDKIKELLKDFNIKIKNNSIFIVL